MRTTEATNCKATAGLLRDWDAWQLVCRRYLRTQECKSNDSVPVKYPSACYTCKWARRTWSTTLQSDGYVGCAYPAALCGQRERQGKSGEDVFDHMVYNIIGEADVVATGWVLLSVAPFGTSEGSFGSGISTNHQLITHQVRQCGAHDAKGF